MKPPPIVRILTPWIGEISWTSSTSNREKSTKTKCKNLRNLFERSSQTKGKIGVTFEWKIITSITRYQKVTFRCLGHRPVPGCHKNTRHWVGVVFLLVPKCRVPTRKFRMPLPRSVFLHRFQLVLQAMETSKERFIGAPRLLDVLCLLLGERLWRPGRNCVKKTEGKSLVSFIFRSLRIEVAQLFLLGVRQTENWDEMWRSCCSCKSFKGFSFSGTRTPTWNRNPKKVEGKVDDIPFSAIFRLYFRWIFNLLVNKNELLLGCCHKELWNIYEIWTNSPLKVNM